MQTQKSAYIGAGSQQTATPGRIIGIQHRIKMTRDEEARPTMVCIQNPDGTYTNYELATEEDESDFIRNQFPTKWREVVYTNSEGGEKQHEDLSGFKPWHIQRDAKKNPTKVPVAYDGLRQNDTVAMILGGSGDYLAFAMVKLGEKIGVKVLRIAPFKIVEFRGDAKKTEDASLLVKLVSEQPEIFEETKPRDLTITRVRTLTRRRFDAMEARITADHRFRQSFIGEYFTREGGDWEDGGLQKNYLLERAQNPGLIALLYDEEEAKKMLENALEGCDIYVRLFKPIEGVGPSIAARIISSIVTIKRFATAPKMRKYCGVHVLDDGRFPRRRNGEVANWSGTIRQGLYLLGDQFNRRPKTPWGRRLIFNKGYYRKKHPYPVLRYKEDSEDKKRELVPDTFTKKGDKYTFHDEGGDVVLKGKIDYSNGHIHKMATWKTLSEFVNWLFDNWWNIERDQAVVEPDDWFAAGAKRRADYEAHIASLTSSEPTGSLDSDGSVEEAA